MTPIKFAFSSMGIWLGSTRYQRLTRLLLTAPARLAGLYDSIADTIQVSMRGDRYCAIPFIYGIDVYHLNSDTMELSRNQVFEGFQPGEEFLITFGKFDPNFCQPEAPRTQWGGLVRVLP